VHKGTLAFLWLENKRNLQETEGPAIVGAYRYLAAEMRPLVMA
jgi:hypothetical protein